MAGQTEESLHPAGVAENSGPIKVELTHWVVKADNGKVEPASTVMIRTTMRNL